MIISRIRLSSTVARVFDLDFRATSENPKPKRQAEALPTEPTTMSRLLILASKLGLPDAQLRGSREGAGRGSRVCERPLPPARRSLVGRRDCVRFDQPEEAARRIVKQSLVRPVDGLIALGDRATATAAYTARALGFAYNSPQAVENCRSKLRQREILRDAGLPVPGFFSFRLDKKLDKILPRVQFPCVVKPLRLAASQGVIRANNAGRISSRRGANRQTLLKSPEIQVTREAELDRLLVERYIPGAEVAVEGLLTRGKLRILGDIRQARSAGRAVFRGDDLRDAVAAAR